MKNRMRMIPLLVAATLSANNIAFSGNCSQGMEDFRNTEVLTSLSPKDEEPNSAQLLPASKTEAKNSKLLKSKDLWFGGVSAGYGISNLTVNGGKLQNSGTTVAFEFGKEFKINQNFNMTAEAFGELYQ